MRKYAYVLAPVVATGLMFACSDATTRAGYAPNPPAEAGIRDDEFKRRDSGIKPEAGCSSTQTTIARTPVVLEFVLDESTSMNDDGKWVSARDALLAAFQDMQTTADGASYVGIQLFSTAPNLSVPPKPLTDPDQYPALVAAVNKGTSGGGSTYTDKALDAAYGIVQNFMPPTSAQLDTSAIKRLVVLLSDGVPSGGGSIQDTIANTVAGKAQEAGPRGPVTTFSVGIGPFPSSDTGYDPAFMGHIAQAGGSAPAGCVPDTTNLANTCHFQVTPGADLSATKQQLIDAINKIRQLSASCEFAFKVTGEGDLNKIEVTIADKAGVVTTLNRDNENGWTFDDDARPTKVVLHGSACSTSTATIQGDVKVVLGCRSAN